MSKRRGKPTNYGRRRTPRSDDECEAAIDAVWSALARERGYDPEQLREKQAADAKRKGRPARGEPTFSDALRILILDNYKTAMLLADSPQEWPTPDQVEIPQRFWDILTDVQNRCGHAQGSLYNISKKLNFGGAVRADEAREAFLAARDLKACAAQLERPPCPGSSARPRSCR